MKGRRLAQLQGARRHHRLRLLDLSIRQLSVISPQQPIATLTTTSRTANECLPMAPRASMIFHSLGLALCLHASPILPGLGQDGSKTHIGEYTASLHGLANPVASAFAPDGSLYVVEEGANRVRGFDATLAPRGELGASSLFSPQGIAVDHRGRVYVSDSGNGRVLCFEDDQAAPKIIAQAGPGNAGLNHPTGLAVDSNRLAIADEGKGLVLLFGLDGTHLGNVGAERLLRPVDVAFEESGDLVVLDGEQVIFFGESGKAEMSFGAWGAFPGLLSSPGGIALHAGRTFVCDTDNHRVQVFDREGEVAYTFGVHAIRPREGKGKLHYPTHVALDNAGSRAALTEPLDGRVQVFRRVAGAQPVKDPLRALGGKASSHYGHDWEVSGGLMAAIEPEARRVQIYDLRLLPKDNPVQITTLGGYGSGLGSFQRPTGLWLDGPGRHLWVCDGARGSLTEVRLDLPPDAELAVDLFLPRVVRGIDLSRLVGAPLPRPYPIAPRDVAQHTDGRLFVLCERNREVLVLDPNLQALGLIDGDGQAFRRPVQIAIDPSGNALWVVDELASPRSFSLRTEDFGSMLASFEGTDPLERPFGITFDPQGQVCISDRATSRIHRRAADGTYSTFGSPGIRATEFLAPRAMGFDDRGLWLILDHGNHRGMVLDQGGEFQFAFGPRLYTKPARLPHTYKPEDYTE